MQATQNILRQKQRKERVQGAIKRVTGAVKSAAKGVASGAQAAGRSAVSGARELVDRPAREYAEKRGVVPSKSGKTALGAGEGIGSVKYKQQTSAGRREVRSRVAGDIASRIRSKPGRVASQVGSAVSGAAQRATTAATEQGQKAKSGIKGLIRRGAEGVARRAQGLASRMATESVDLYDVVLEHLLDEGFAESVESAEVIMTNMSEDWRNEILEANLTPADIERIAVTASGKKKKRPAKLPGNRE